jgi:hypothetical protein
LRTLPLLALTALLLPTSASPQGTRADYLRADSFAAKTRGLVVDVAEAPNWIGETSRFWYRKSVEGGHAFVLVNPLVPEKGPAFHHERLAGALASLPSFQEDTVTAVEPPLHPVHLRGGRDGPGVRRARTPPGGAAWQSTPARTWDP